MGSKANQNLISCQTLALSPFSPIFFLKNGIAHKMSPKTTFWPFNALLSVRPCLAYTHFSFLNFFFVLSHLSFLRPCLAQNLLFHLSLLLFHFGHSFIINSPRHLFFIIIDP